MYIKIVECSHVALRHILWRACHDVTMMCSSIFPKTWICEKKRKKPSASNPQNKPKTFGLTERDWKQAAMTSSPLRSSCWRSIFRAQNPKKIPGAPLTLNFTVASSLCETWSFCSLDLKKATFLTSLAKCLILCSYKTKEICREWREADVWILTCILISEMFFCFMFV